MSNEEKMMDIKCYIASLINSVKERYSKLDKVREEIIKLNRDALNHATEAIRMINSEEYKKAAKEIRLADSSIKNAIKLITSLPLNGYTPYYLYRILAESLREFIEAILLYVYVSNDISYLKCIPCNIPDEIYINAIFDFTGELRRYLLTALIKGDINMAEETAIFIKDLYNMLVTLTVKSYYISNFKRSLDLLRYQLEKSLEDISLAKYSLKTSEKINGDVH